jgi:hypothetical protein
MLLASILFLCMNLVRTGFCLYYDGGKRGGVGWITEIS